MKNRMIAAGLLLSALCTPALAQDCKPLRLIDTIKMTTLEDGRRTIPVKVNGTELTMLLDTAGFISQISAEGASRANLHVQKSNDTLRMYNVSGQMSQQSAAVDELMIGRLRFSKTRLFVMSESNVPRQFDGLIAANMLFNYDIELDFTDNVMRYFMTDHCPGKVIHWKADAAGMVPIVLRDKGHIEVEIVLDGKKFEAIVDTGATDTFVSDLVAKYFLGAGDPSPETERFAFMGIENDAYARNFSRMEFGDITVLNPRIVVYRDRFRDKDRTQQTGNRALRDSDNIPGAKLTIGMNILRRLHPYFAFGEKRLYVTPAAAAASTPASGTAPKP